MNSWTKKPKAKNSLVVVFVCAVLLLALDHGSFGAAQQVDQAAVSQLQNEKDKLEAKLTQINNQIKSYQGQIDTTKKQAASLKNEVFIYDAQIASTELQIQAKETEIADANLQIEELSRQIDRRVVEINENKERLAQLMLELYQLDSQGFLTLGLGTEDFSEFLDQMHYNSTVQARLYEVTTEIKKVKATLEAQRQELQKQLTELEQLHEALEVSQAALSGQRTQKQRLLDQTRGLESNYRKLLAVSQKEEADLQKEVEDLDQTIRAKLGQKVLQPAKGALAKPMKGIITQKYGKTSFTALGYNFHNGIDIAAPAGQPIYAPADGIVKACDTGEASYGNWCAMSHKIESADGKTRDIITIFGHMRSFKVKKGDMLKQGELIGYEGNTGNTTRLLYGPERGYHLHFMVCDAEGFGIAAGKYTKTYGPYTVPYCYTYNPLDFVSY